MEVVEGVVRVGEDAGDDDETAGDGGERSPPDAPPRFADVDAFVAELGRVGEEHGTAVQAFDARLVVDRAHLESAVAHADRAFERGENVARDRAVEILLYAAGRRQINRALAMGVEEGETPAVVVVAGEDDPASDDGTGASEPTPAEAGAAEAVAALLEPADTLGVAADAAAIREFFDVTDAELAATEADLSALVRERVALLDVEK